MMKTEIFNKWNVQRRLLMYEIRVVLGWNPVVHSMLVREIQIYLILFWTTVPRLSNDNVLCTD
jgi:hypothetical protein